MTVRSGPERVVIKLRREEGRKGKIGFSLHLVGIGGSYNLQVPLCRIDQDEAKRLCREGPPKSVKKGA